MALGFLGGPYTVQQMTRAVQAAEQQGFESAWVANDIGGRDPYISLASFAMVTQHMRLGVAVSNPYTRHPVELAQTVATLDEASGGRAVLGIGTGASWRSLIAGHWNKPIAHLKESIQTMRQLWAQAETTYQSVPVSIRDSDWVWPTGAAATFREHIPIYLGAAGPRMTRLAAQLADGLVIAAFKFRSAIAAQVRQFHEAAAPAGRGPAALEVAALIGMWVTEAGDDLDVMRRTIAFELSRLDETVAVEQGFDLEAFRAIKRIYARQAGEGGVVKYGREPAAYEAAPYVTRQMLEAFAVAGTPDECARQLERYAASGVSLPILVPLGCDLNLVLEAGRMFCGRPQTERRHRC